MQLAHNGSFKKYWLDESDTIRSDGFVYVDVIPDTTWMLHGDSIRLGYYFFEGYLGMGYRGFICTFGPKGAALASLLFVIFESIDKAYYPIGLLGVVLLVLQLTEGLAMVIALDHQATSTIKDLKDPFFREVYGERSMYLNR